MLLFNTALAQQTMSLTKSTLPAANANGNSKPTWTNVFCVVCTSRSPHKWLKCFLQDMMLRSLSYWFVIFCGISCLYLLSLSPFVPTTKEVPVWQSSTSPLPTMWGVQKHSRIGNWQGPRVANQSQGPRAPSTFWEGVCYACNLIREFTIHPIHIPSQLTWPLRLPKAHRSLTLLSS